jgi:hypothetical protein
MMHGVREPRASVLTRNEELDDVPWCAIEEVELGSSVVADRAGAAERQDARHQALLPAVR